MIASVLQWQMISQDMRQILASFAKAEISKHFYLAGGTALALQLGHRRSGDLDFFSNTDDVPLLIEPLRKSLYYYRPERADSAWGNLVFLVKGIRVGFYSYGYDLLEPWLEADGNHLAGVVDIGLMKLDAILGRAGRKDFYDLYEICKQHPLRELLDLAPRKYPGVRDFEVQVVKRLVYFERAEQDYPPPLLVPVEWETVKDFFRQQAEQIGKKWVGGSDT